MQRPHAPAKKDNAADFYGSLVALDPAAPKWSSHEGGAGLGAAARPAPAAAPDLSVRARKPVAFRSAGVHDLSALNPNTILRPGDASGGTSSSSVLGGGAGASGGQLGVGAAAGGSSWDGVVIVPPPPRVHVEHEGAAPPMDRHHHHRHRGGSRGAGGAGEGGGGSSQEDAPAGNPLTRAAPRSLREAEAVLASQWKAASAQRQEAGRPKIAAGNVGYQLLKAAGWTEGTGLGAQGQGRLAPIDPHKNPGTRGIGFDRKPGAQLPHDPPAARRQQDEAEAAAHAAKRARIAEIVQKELAGESVEQKVARHQAVIAAEAKEARGRAIQRALYRAFDDPLDNAGAPTANSNPLGRRTRLTALNPLLDDDDL